MPIDPQLKAQLRQIITYAASAATANVYGEVSVGSTATAWCRQELRTRSIQRLDGTYQATRTPLVVLDSDVGTPTFESRFWLPDTSPNSAAFARQPKVIECCIDADGAVDHWELEF